MRVAFISFEYPPDTGFGGIATYVSQAAKMFAEAGHEVEVFCGAFSLDRVGVTFEGERLLVHRVRWTGHDAFRNAVVGALAARHASSPFDVAEVPEWRADGLHLKEVLPDLPFVVKLHTCTELISRLNMEPIPLRYQLRRYLGAWRRGRLFPAAYNYKSDPEYLQTQSCDEIVAPSLSIRDETCKLWHFDCDSVAHVPYPFSPPKSLLELSLSETSNRILFLGRLEPRKGVWELADAIPLVLKKFPNAKFKFVGSSPPTSGHALGMRALLRRKLLPFEFAVDFQDAVPNAGIASVFSEADICVFPSRWENFPLVCLEAMAAGRAIIGSSCGGMKEQLAEGNVGVLVTPRRPKQLAKAILALLGNPARCKSLGYKAREKVLRDYCQKTIGPLQEASYRRAIARHSTRLNCSSTNGLAR